MLSEIFMQITTTTTTRLLGILTKLRPLKLAVPVIMPHRVRPHYEDRRYRGARKIESKTKQDQSQIQSTGLMSTTYIWWLWAMNVRQIVSFSRNLACSDFLMLASVSPSFTFSLSSLDKRPLSAQPSRINCSMSAVNNWAVFSRLGYDLTHRTVKQSKTEQNVDLYGASSRTRL